MKSTAKERENLSADERRRIIILQGKVCLFLPLKDGRSISLSGNERPS